MTRRFWWRWLSRVSTIDDAGAVIPINVSTAPWVRFRLTSRSGA